MGNSDKGQVMAATAAVMVAKAVTAERTGIAATVMADMEMTAAKALTQTRH